MIKERFILSVQRIKEIAKSAETEAQYQDYFRKTADFLLQVEDIVERVQSGVLKQETLKQKQERNQRLYQDILPGQYEESYANPAYAVSKLGENIGVILSAVYAELRSTIAYAYDRKTEAVLIRYELFLQIYTTFAVSWQEKENVSYEELQDIYGAFAYDYVEQMTFEQVEETFTCTERPAYHIVLHADLLTNDYLYDYGEYISDNEVQMADFLRKLPEEEIQRIADTFTEGYRIGFETTGKDISIKETVNIRYFIGFERVVRQAVINFENIGMETILYRAQPSFICGRSIQKNGYFATIPNKQFECDHEYDKALFYHNQYRNRKLETYHAALENYKAKLALFGGPAVIESFGEKPFSPVTKKEAVKMNDRQQKLSVEYMAKAGELLNRYVKGEERSFTIIAFPIPEIGAAFEQIFEDVIKINTLNYEKYQHIQQTIIDTLDQADYVKVLGCGENQTNLQIALWKLKKPEKETIFENCVADVNIPVGEVFTSPVLEGTEGTLHVTEVFLNGLQYQNLKFDFKDGMVTDYSCSNFSDASEGKKYLKDHVLHQHDTLPMGEFAIGTNTVAYMTARKYSIGNVMPILIAEKTGPHFAVGDTCYSHEEDIMTYNPDGKAIVARENSVSALRHTDMEKAYTNCHTDITIPYDELGLLTAVKKDGTTVDIIKNGRFVLQGCEELNKPFDE